MGLYCPQEREERNISMFSRVLVIADKGGKIGAFTACY